MKRSIIIATLALALVGALAGTAQASPHGRTVRTIVASENYRVPGIYAHAWRNGIGRHARFCQFTRDRDSYVCVGRLAGVQTWFFLTRPGLCTYRAFTVAFNTIIARKSAHAC
jgi:hypothetical protein